MGKIKITESSGNVFEDMGLPDAKEHKVKADLVLYLAKLIEEADITQTEAARRLGVSQPDVSRMLKGHFRAYSVDRLMFMLTKLGQDVTIGVAPAKWPKKIGSLTVTACH